jgi:hypothetical protein
VVLFGESDQSELDRVTQATGDKVFEARDKRAEEIDRAGD